MPDRQNVGFLGRNEGLSGLDAPKPKSTLLTRSVISPPSIDALRKAHSRLLPCAIRS
jgi:hypothetical protein